jgi:hypothetical protein
VSNGGATGVAPSLEASSLENLFGCASGVGGGALVRCRRLGAEGPWVLDVLGWRAGCCGELVVSWGGGAALFAVLDI